MNNTLAQTIRKLEEALSGLDKSLTLSLALPFLWLALFRLVLLPVGENCFDPYYHVSMADAGPSAIFSKTFPSMTMSVWENSFSDKEALYHVALWALRHVQAALGLPLGYPFNFPALAFDAFAVCAFVFALRSFGVHATLYPALAFVLASPFFTNRLLMLRPHVLSIALLCLGAALFARAKGRWGAWASLALGALYSWAYSNPHFILFPAFCMGAARLPQEGWRKAFSPLLFATIGAVGAQIVHPQFPNTVSNWEIQCVSVVAHSLLPASYPINSPDELRGPSPLWLTCNFLTYAIFLFNLGLSLALRAKHGIAAIPPTAQGLLAASAIAIAGTFFGIRAMEYACPFTIMAAATLTASLASLPEPLKGFNFSRVAKLELLALLAMAAAAELFIQGIPCVAPPEGLAAWAQKSGRLPPGTRIANLAWSDFTILHYKMPECRYLCGLDPMFAFSRDPENFTKIERFRMLELWLKPEELAKVSGAAFVYVRPIDKILGKEMEMGGYKVAYKSGDGWLFELPKGKALNR